MQTEEIVTNETTNEESKDSKTESKFKKRKSNRYERFSVPFMESVVMDEAAKKLFA